MGSRQTHGVSRRWSRPQPHVSGKPRGSAAERHAHCIWKDLRHESRTDLIDLHTDVAGAIPYAIVDRVVRVRDRRRLTSECARLANASGLTVLAEYPKDRYLRYNLDRSLPGAMINLAGVPAVTLEVGPRRRLDPEAAATATGAVLGVLTEMGVVRSLPPDAGVPVGPLAREALEPTDRHARADGPAWRYSRGTPTRRCVPSMERCSRRRERRFRAARADTCGAGLRRRRSQ